MSVDFLTPFCPDSLPRARSGSTPVEWGLLTALVAVALITNVGGVQKGLRSTYVRLMCTVAKSDPKQALPPECTPPPPPPPAPAPAKKPGAKPSAKPNTTPGAAPVAAPPAVPPTSAPPAGPAKGKPGFKLGAAA